MTARCASARPWVTIMPVQSHSAKWAHESAAHCSADCQSAVSQVANLRYSRLPIGATNCRRFTRSAISHQPTGHIHRIALLLALLIIALPNHAEAAAPPAKPHFIVILADDLGYGDLGCYGAKSLTTPHLDRMAREGMRFTDFCVAAPLCSPSRVALLSGRYPQRVGIPGGIGPKSNSGIAASEKLLPEILRDQGYRTALIGKWHLGHRKEFLPLQHGFDEWLGTPASNDTAHENRDPAMGFTGTGLLLFEGNRVIEIAPDQSQLTTRYAERATRFIGQHTAQPFFLYVAPNMPHTPLAVSPKFRGQSGRGLYGDVVAELDWAVGQLLGALQRHGLEDRTLVIFTSDNGPWLIFGDHGGSAGPLRGGKKQTFEGGVRVPCVMRWPGRIPAGRVCHELVTSLEILPTLTRLADGRLPDRQIDGFDIWPVLSGATGTKSPRETFLYYWQKELHAVRSGPWKLQLPHPDAQTPDPARIGRGGERGAITTAKLGLALYDLQNDLGESQDVALKHPQVVQQLQRLAGQARADLGDDLAERRGSERRRSANPGDPSVGPR